MKPKHNICTIYSLILLALVVMSTNQSNVTNEISILSLNIFMRPPFITNNGNDYKDLRLSYLIKHVLINYDIVCFQEAFKFGSNRINNLMREASKIGFIYQLSLQKPPYKLGIDGGLLVLSKLQIVESKQAIYKNGLGVDNLSFKGAIYARILLSKDKHLNLFNTHLQASYTQPLDVEHDPSVLTRFQQLKELIRFIKLNEKGKDGSINLLVGDFNINSRTKTQISKHSDEYLKFIDLISRDKSLTFTDMLYQRENEHKITFGDYYINDNNQKIPKETILTNRDEYFSAQSLDYAFFIEHSSNETSSSYKAEARVEEFFIKDRHFAPVTQVSDHYGIEIKLITTNSSV